MRGLCFSNKGIYKFETTPEKVKLNELNNNTVEELSIAEFDYKLYSGEIIRITKEIKEAYRKMMEAKDDSVTDDGMVMETYGIRGVRMIKGSYENIKITTPEDLAIAEIFLKNR